MAVLHCNSDTVGNIQQVEDSPRHKYEKPYEIVGPLPPEHEHMRSNITWAAHKCNFRDLRRDEKPEFIDQGILQILSNQPVDPGVLIEDEQYADHIAGMLKKVFDAELVIAYDLRRRTSGGLESQPKVDRKWDQPAFGAHVDHTYLGGERRVRHHLSEAEIEKYLQNPSDWKIRIINAWRPINNRVEDVPLAFCDPRTVEFDDILVTDRPSVDSIREISFVKYRPGQQWYWLSDQTPDELFVFVQWDSDKPADCVPGIPHVAFTLDRPTKSSHPRESVEVRSIVITRKTS